MIAKGYALWLMPTGELYSDLSDTIIRLSQQFQTPAFSPHITLLSGLADSEKELVSKASHLSSFTKSFEIRLRNVGFRDEYFRCLFIHVEETTELLEAHSKAAKVFARPQDSQLMPHLSIVYGNLSSAEKQELVNQLKLPIGMSFRVDRVHLFLTEGRPADWRPVGEFKLS
jgi:2'-5' RNA ligase